MGCDCQLLIKENDDDDDDDDDDYPFQFSSLQACPNLYEVSNRSQITVR